MIARKIFSFYNLWMRTLTKFTSNWTTTTFQLEQKSETELIAAKRDQSLSEFERMKKRQSLQANWGYQARENKPLVQLTHFPDFAFASGCLEVLILKIVLVIRATKVHWSLIERSRSGSKITLNFVIHLKTHDRETVFSARFFPSRVLSGIKITLLVYSIPKDDKETTLQMNLRWQAHDSNLSSWITATFWLMSLAQIWLSFNWIGQLSTHSTHTFIHTQCIRLQAVINCN